MSDHNDIDVELRAAGERWRATRRPGPTRVDPALFTGHRQPSSFVPRMARSIASIAAVGAVGLLAVLVLVFIRPTDQQPGPPPLTTAPTSGTAAPTAVPSVPPSEPPTSSPPASSPAAITLDRVANVALDRSVYGSQYAANGPRAVYSDGRRRDGQRITLADLTAATIDRIAMADSGNEVGAIALEGNHVLWVEGDYARRLDRVPCATGGALTWKIRLLDLATGQVREIASGIQARDSFCGGSWPVIALDGDRLAYATEFGGVDDATWQINLVSLGDGSSSSLPTRFEVASLALSGTDLAYVEGTYIGYGQYGATHLMISTAAQPEPAELTAGEANPEITAGPQSVALARGRLVWSDTGSGDGPAPLLTATFDQQEPRMIAELSNFLSRRDYSIASDTVVWTEYSTPGIHLWRPDAPTTWAIDVEDPSLPTISDGWLTWYSDAPAGQPALYGVQLVDLPLD